MSRSELEFVYKLNALEMAAMQDNPSEHQYREKRKAVVVYVERLGQEITDLKIEVKAQQALLDGALLELCEWKSGRIRFSGHGEI